jgi:adenine-specific DNA methylase
MLIIYITYEIKGRIMNKEFLKEAGIEEATLSDPRTGLPIRVSTTTRMKYRKYFNEIWSDKRDMLYDLSNRKLNDVIAQDFAASADSAVHMFLSNSSDISSKKREWIEIRKVKTRRAFNFFFSIIRQDGIDILTTSTVYRRPKKPRLFVPKF